MCMFVSMWCVFCYVDVHDIFFCAGERRLSVVGFDVEY
jgi:hypothetical protein